MTSEMGGAVKSADRVLDLLELMAGSDAPLSHGEITLRLGIPKSSLTPLLRNMVARGYVEPTGDGRSYRLGIGFFNLSRASRRSFDIVAEAAPFLMAATAQLGESSAFNQLRGHEVEVMATVIGPHRLVTHMRLGDRAPLYATSGGKTILAHADEAFRSEYLETIVFERWTPGTHTSKAKLLEDLERVRDTGFGYSLEEWTPGIIGVGMAVLDLDSRPVGSINHAIPVARFGEDMKRRAQESVKQCVRDLAARMFDV